MSGARLIVNADDFGLSIGITDGICLAHRHGIVTSTSVIVNTPAFDYAIGRLDEFPSLGVGVHLNVCQGRPVLPRERVRTLIDATGKFHSPAAMARKLTLWQVDPWELESEFRAQIQWLKWHAGNVLHADSHQHMHLYPAAVLPFAHAVAAEDIPCIRTARCRSWASSQSLGSPHAGGIVRRRTVALYRSTLQRTALARFDAPQGRLCFPARDKEPDWHATFSALPPGTFELSCHPGLVQPGFSHSDRISSQREDELRQLTSPQIRDAVERSGVELITYADLCHRQSEALRLAAAPLERHVG
jgi:predicted glycoside hydrolase/deacetylase ChbG (UPF0249 family)